MTKRSRKVLEDCKGALFDLRDGVQGDEWRRRWVAAVVLLRTVGHVLEKIDAKADHVLKNIIDKEWNELQKTKPEPNIFWTFIEEERNNILKEYQINASQGVTICASPIISKEKKSGPPLYTVNHYEITSGSYKGQDQREVLKEAIEWWEQYLLNIEQQYHKKKSPK